MAAEQWHLDKRVPIALILAIVVQTSGAIWWASSMTERMGQIERRMDSEAAQSQNVENLVASQATQIAVLVERIEAQNRNVDRLSQEVASTNGLLRDYLRRNGSGQ